MNKEQQLKLLEESRDILQNQIDELNNEKIDFSEFVGRYETSLVIKWEKNLISYSNWDIGYAKVYTTFANPDYTHTTVGELERGDVFICEDNVEDMELRSFNVYVEKCQVQYLSNASGVETIRNYNYSQFTKVIKFLRT